jgi:AcrR family transcriptional regulator
MEPWRDRRRAGTFGADMQDLKIKDGGRAPQAADAALERPMRREDWIEAGLALLVSEGIYAVRITRLADALGVTRGSFYWHFKGRDDLLDELVGHWGRRNTRAITATADGALDLTSGILALFEVWLEAERFDPLLDSALRDWARRSDKVRRAVEEADDARVQAIAELFARSGYDATDAFIRARIIYFTQVGYYALGIREALERRFEYLEAYFEGFTGQTLDPDIAEAYRAKHLGRRRR